MQVFNDVERKRFETAWAAFLVKRRPPFYLRNQIDITYKIAGSSVELEEIRLLSSSGLVSHRSFAKATYIPTEQHWELYWMRSNLNWHTYEPCAAVLTLEEFLEEVDQDLYGCFFG